MMLISVICLSIAFCEAFRPSPDIMMQEYRHEHVPLNIPAEEPIEQHISCDNTLMIIILSVVLFMGIASLILILF